MTDPITDERLAELRARADYSAHSLPWHLSESVPADGVRTAAGWEVVSATYGNGWQLELIVTAVNAMPDLLAEVKQMKAERDEARVELARVTNLARADEEAHRSEIRQILAFHDGSGGIPFVGDADTCAQHGCPRALCECFPAPSADESEAVDRG